MKNDEFNKLIMIQKHFCVIKLTDFSSIYEKITFNILSSVQ